MGKTIITTTITTIIIIKHNRKIETK